MKKREVLMFLCALALWGLGACTAMKTPIVQDEWLKKMLYNPVCQIPCWENIMPGETQQEDVLEILKDNPDVKIDTTEIVSYAHRYRLNLGTGRAGGIIESRNYDQGLVSYVILSPDVFQLTLKEIVEVYGEPKHIALAHCGDPNRCEVHLVYDSVGLEIVIFNHSKILDTKIFVEIRPDDFVGRLRLFPKGLDGYLRQGGIGLEELHLWDGYGSYSP